MYLDSAWGWGYDFILRRTRHYSVYEGDWDYDFILHRTPITPHTHTAINATCYKRTCCSPRGNTSDTRSIHSTNEDQRRAVIAIVVYLDSTWTWNYDLILRRVINNLTCVKFTQYKRTRCSSRDNTTPVPHTFIERSSMQNRHCHCSVVYQDEITTSYCIEHQCHLQFQANTQQYKRTACSSRARQHDTHFIHSTNEDQPTQTRHRHCA